jgi:hypothetical protein
VADRPDFAKARLRPEEWPLIRDLYAETYPVRPLVNHCDEMKSLLEFAIDEIRLQTDMLEKCHMHPVSKRVEPVNVEGEIRENREWIRKAEAAVK